MTFHLSPPDLVLTRFCWSELGVFGELYVDGQRLYTVERPWLGNQRSVSCIPLGFYDCQPRRYHRGGYDAVEVCNVPDRTHILFHRANTASDLAGCIGVASRLGCLENTWAALGSRPAFELFMRHFNRPFVLEIRSYQPVVEAA